MRSILYYIAYLFILWLSYLPFWLLYGISDLLYLLIFYVIKYRKKLVYSNLKNSFPNKSHKELVYIQKAFYRHFADFLVETLKTFSISSKQLNKRFDYKNLDLLSDYTQKGRSVLIVAGHYANWEWVIGGAKDAKLNLFITYTRISNAFFNRWIKNNRERFGAHLIVKQDTYSVLADNHAHKLASVYGLLSDQAPRNPKKRYWTDFLGHQVPVFNSAETIAKKYDDVIVFMQIDKVKRGRYEVHFDLISDQVKEHPDYALTDLFFKKLSAQITAKPEFYLWTHNRYKHVKEVPKNKE